MIATKRVVTRTPELVREFVHDCLYNPEYGYFSRIVNIFDGGQPINFKGLRDQEDYVRHLHSLYRNQSRNDDEYYQLWHTPSELFKPWYGHGITNYMLNEMKDLVIYEIGPGNGTMAKSILDYLKHSHQSVYSKTEYNLVDISTILNEAQRKKLFEHNLVTRFHRCSALDLSIFDTRPCFVLAMEVLDNMPHDLIRYAEDGQLLQGMVYTNDKATALTAFPGRYSQDFEPCTDKLVLEYVGLRDRLGYKSPSLQWHPLDFAERTIGSENPWRSEFIPTTSYQLLKKLCSQLPKHRLIISDFSSLPDTIKGHKGPVVQTRYQGDTVACSTYLLQRGLFDIFFPTDFELLRSMHGLLAKVDGKILPHAQFCQQFASYQNTETRSGYNPMLEEFENVKFYLS